MLWGMESDATNRERLAATFDSAAALYQRARSEYPAALYERLLEVTGLQAPAALLEVGCATGKATLPLARVGFRITALEPGAALAAAARANVVGYDVDVVEARFEDWEPNGAVFDLVFAATAWHWVDAEVRYPKAAAVLRPHGSGGVGRRACDPPRRGPVLRRDPGDLRGDWGGAPCQLR